MMKMKRIFFRSICLVFIISLFIGIPVLTDARTSDIDQSSLVSSITCSIASQDDNQTMTITPDSPLKDGDAKAEYSQELQVHSGSGSYTWALQKGSKLPSGLKLKGDKLDSSKATIYGKPAKPVDNYSFTVQVTDKTTGEPATKLYYIHINPAVSLTVPKFPAFEEGAGFPQWIPSASGGDDNYTWSITKGQLPDNLTLNPFTGEITGIPSKSGSFKATLEVKDSIEGFASKALSFKVLSRLEIKTSTLPSCDVEIAYKSVTLKAEGGKKPYKWTVLEDTGEGDSSILEGYDSLPPGFTLIEKGVITGTPEVGSSGTYKFKVLAKDSLGEVIQGTALQELSLTINQPLAINTNIPSDGYLNDVCSYTLNPSGGSGSGYKWTLTKLPSGLKLVTTKVNDNTTYTIAGTLKKEGTYNIIIKLTDSLKGVTTQAVPFRVFGARPQVASVTPQDNATDVAVDTTVTAVFSQQMDDSTISTNSFTLKAGAVSVPALVSFNNDTKTATLTPESDLANSTVYTAALTTDIKGLNGSSLADQKIWNFTTIADLIPPQVISVNPTDQADEVDFDASITVIFSESIDPATLSADTFTLIKGNKAVQGTVEPLSGSDNKAATFKPKEKLLSHTEYTAEVTPEITDAAGNPLAAAYSWSFTTCSSDTLVRLISASSVVVNEEFVVEVHINNVSDLNTYQFQINYNSTVIEMVNSALYTDGMEDGQVGSIVFTPSWYIPYTGSIRWACELPANVTANGQGYLFKLHFKALKAGQSAFVFTDVEDVQDQEDFFNNLFDAHGHIIPFEKANGQITVTAH
jgi:hypothetical protein